MKSIRKLSLRRTLLFAMVGMMLVAAAIGGARTFAKAEGTQGLEALVGKAVQLDIGENLVPKLKVVYSSSDPSIVEVQADNTMIAKAVGTATITADITRNTIKRTATFVIEVKETVADPEAIYYLCTACSKIFTKETASSHAIVQCPDCYCMYNKCLPVYHGVGRCVDKPSKAPETTEAPKTTDDPVMPDDPVASGDPVTSEEPVASGDPVTSEDPQTPGTT